MLGKPKEMKAIVLQLKSKKRYQENLDKLVEQLRTHLEKEIIVAP